MVSEEVKEVLEEVDALTLRLAELTSKLQKLNGEDGGDRAKNGWGPTFGS